MADRVPFQALSRMLYQQGYSIPSRVPHRLTGPDVMSPGMLMYVPYF
jgi:hypothetical protein